jgi:glucosamine-6-phosphate deaminase
MKTGKSIHESDPEASLKKTKRISVEVFIDSDTGSKSIAREIATLIKNKQKKHLPCILGLATGSTPKKVYAELIRFHKEEKLSFKNVITFNLDEYYPMQPDDSQSYVRFMEEQLFHHVDIPKSNYNIPDGTLSPEDISEFCINYDNKIADLGGLDLQLLGIGSNGHIGFNEPGSLLNSTTRLVYLNDTTRDAAAGDFQGIANVPKKAITMGVSTIMNAKRIILMAWGEGKSKIVKTALEGSINHQVPASFLQAHENVSFFIDEACSIDLER